MKYGKNTNKFGVWLKVYLEERKYKIMKKQISRFINTELDLDSESDSKSDAELIVKLKSDSDNDFDNDSE